ncbi:uncharacterized protein ATC70_005192 [Mucor velutinosus]|uniref:Nitrogen regulatory protein areA GATA-like domain-containing protein n=1 Tax=Mucor velutinosus TaxID=708070 RepID=A0AAN7D5H9_9FUNG|nr:hypothetical protein ATC70_005192 [Mucor velutinosus]
MAHQSQQCSFLSVSCSNLDSSENQLATMWGAFAKCKPFIENGTRLENMSWRLWQYQRQPTNYIDNTTIKRFITSVLLSPVSVHDAYSHEVAQHTQKCYTPTTTTTMAPAELESATSSFIVVDDKAKADDMPAKEQQDEQHGDDDDDDNDDTYEDDEYEDDEDYYLSDDLYDDEDDDLYEDDHVDNVKANPSQIKEESQFNHDFKKMQPRPTTPRRSLLSDLLGRVSSPPSLLSNSTCSFTTNNSLTEDESSSASSSSSASTSSSTTTNNTTTKYTTNHPSKIALNTQHHPFTNNTTNDLSEIRWRESFHGW